MSDASVYVLLRLCKSLQSLEGFVLNVMDLRCFHLVCCSCKMLSDISLLRYDFSASCDLYPFKFFLFPAYYPELWDTKMLDQQRAFCDTSIQEHVRYKVMVNTYIWGFMCYPLAPSQIDLFAVSHRTFSTTFIFVT